MKVVFLDIDGVLNSNVWNETHQSEINKGELIDETKVVLLSKIIRETNAVIVLHSAWRFWFNHDLQPMRKEACNLINLFNKNNVQIYSQTPDLSDDDIRKTKKFSLVKAKEIIAWLKDHDDVVEYIVVEDLDLHNELIMKHQIKPDSLIGLTEEDAKRAIEFLLKEI